MSKREKQIYRKAYIEGMKVTLGSIALLSFSVAMFITVSIRAGILVFN